MSCNRCANQAEAAMEAAGVPASQAQATWAGEGAGRPGNCPHCDTFLTRLGQCRNFKCPAVATDPATVPSPPSSRDSAQDYTPPSQDYTITAADQLGTGGAKTKFQHNLAALKLLKQLEAEDRPATPEEQARLVKYAGWGGLAAVFRKPSSWRKTGWEKENAALWETLGKLEWDGAKASTPNAHYTSPEIITAMWEGLRRLGFEGGTVLEPAAGIGHFFGLMPPKVAARSTRVAVELDGLSARLTAKLYPGATVHACGFEKAPLPDNFFDVAVSNVPFGNYPVHDPTFPKDKQYLTGSIHNYFLAKALDKVRPGGVVAFVTSRYTMDGKDPAVRAYLASRADLLGAVRLPNTAFKQMADTDVTTDVLFLRKRAPGDPPADVAWTETVPVTLPRSKDGRGAGEDEFAVNEYFVDHPDMMLGKLEASGSMYGRYEVQLVPADDGGDLGSALSAALSGLPQDVMKTGRSTEPATSLRREPSVERSVESAHERPGHCPSCGGFLTVGGRCNNPHCPRNAPTGMPRGLVTGAPVQDGAFAVGDDGKVYRGGAPQDGMAEEDRERLAGMLAVRDAAREVLRLNVEGGDDAALAEAQGALNAAYDGFVAAHGPLGLPQNRKLLEGDPDLPFLLALEKDYDPRAKTAVKAQIFSQRTIRRQVSPRQAETAKDALLVALNETGRVDWERMEGLTGLAARELQQQLAGEVFRNPEGGWETADAYLSGDVKSKLAAAEAAAQIDPAYHLNVEALREVQPPDLLPSQIHAAPGSPWVPPDVVTAFTQHLFGQTLVAHYVPTLAEWTLKPSHPYWFNRHSAAITKKWGTARVDGITLLHQALNGRAPRVTDPDPDDPDRRVVNPAETLAAREMQDKIKAEFARWAWAEPERAGRLAQIYNDRFNRIVPRKFDGAHLTLPGIGAAMPELRPQQKDAIWRVVQSRSNTLLGHRVGAGKTFAMIGAGMELRRLGLRNKVMHVIPNHMLEQYGDDFARMYPGAKVLLISARDLGARRAEVMSRIATEDWDAVVVTHNAFGKLPLSADTYTSFMRQEIAKLDAELHAIEQEGRDDVAGRHSVKSIEKAKKRMRVRMEKYAAAHTKDKTVTFEQTGVDHLFVDEADVFKNLYFPTRRSRVAGIAQSHSLRAFDMYMKSRYLQRHCGTCGRFVSPDGVCRSCLGKTTLATGGVTFATGTPISNSVVEMYTMMRYLMPERLRELGLEHFDAWATQFGDSVTALEMKPSGDGYREYTRFAKFNNVPELLRLFSEIADVKMDPEELGLALPGLAGGKAVAISAPPSPELKEFIQECAERADNLGSVDPSVDNMLKIIGEANLAALDMRLIDPSLPDDPHGKVNRAVEQILAVYQKTTGVEIETEKGIENMAQVVFLDVSTPKPGQFNVYDDLKAKLIAGGVPEDELAFIHDAKNDAAKQRLFDRVNAGRVRVIVGSTEKMGSGTNIQRRLAALHHLDAPWRPRDVEQREGRILRPGNMNAEVEIYRYVTEESFDVYKWQILQSKARFIAQVMTGDLQERSMEDIDAVTLGYAEMKALATGNPVIIEHIKTGGELQKLLSLRKAYHDKAHRTRLEIGSCHWRIEAARDNVARLRGALAAVAQAPQDFRATFGQASYGPQDKEAAGQAFMAALAAVEGTYKGEALGTLRGFPVIVEGRGPEQYPTARVRLTPDVEVAVTPGVSPAGNVTRLMNAVDSSTARIEAERKRIGEWQAQIAELTVELQKPFEREAEIATLQARLEELEAQIAELERGGRGEKDESAQDD